MKTKLGIIIDFIVTKALIFIIAFVWTRFYLRNIWLTVLLSAIITACISVIIHVLTRGKRTRKKTDFVREEKKRDILNQFLYNDNQFALDFFAVMLSAKHKVDKENNYLIVNEEILLFTKLSTTPLSSNDLCGMISAARKINYKKLAVLTFSAAKDINSIINIFPDFLIDLYDAEMTYSLLEKFNTFPDIKINIKKQKPKLRDALPLIFSRSKVKSYILAAVLMLMGSFFMPYSVYYSVMSSLLLLMAILSYKEVFTKKVNKVDRLI